LNKKYKCIFSGLAVVKLMVIYIHFLIKTNISCLNSNLITRGIRALS